jgi:hypothetical protein
MKTKYPPPRSLLLLLALGMGALISTSARAGDVYLTGHDILLHSGQNGYDAVILNYLRGATPIGSYDIGVVGTAGVGFAQFTGQGFTNIATVGHGNAIPLTGTLTGYSSATFYDAAALAADPTRAAILAGLDVLVILSHTSCGGCSLTTAGSNALNSMAGDIATAFNAGMDIWGNSGASLVDDPATPAITENYYGFLPAGAAASGVSIGQSFGFSATAAGVAIGITNPMINGFPTHNNFTSMAAAFTVFETHTTDGIISIGLKDGRIDDGGIIIDPGTPGVPDSGSSALLLGLVLPVLGLLHRKLRPESAK